MTETVLREQAAPSLDQRNSGIAPETHDHFPELETARFDLADLKRGQELGFFEPKISEQADDEPEEEVLVGFVDYEKPHHQEAVSEKQQVKEEAGVGILLFDHLPDEPERDEFTVEVQEIEAQQEQVSEYYQQFLEVAPKVEEKLVEHDIEALLDEEEEGGQLVENTNRSTIDVIEPTSENIPNPAKERENTKSREITDYNVASTVDTKDYVEWQPSPQREPSSVETLEVARAVPNIEQEVESLLSIQHLPASPELKTQLTEQVAVYYQELVEDPTKLEQVEAELLTAKEGRTRSIEQPEEVELVVRSYLESDLNPEEQLERHKDELARIEACVLARRQITDSSGKREDFSYGNDTEGRDRLELLLADQAAITLVAELLCRHQDDLKQFGREIERHFEGYIQVRIDLNDEEEQLQPHIWHRPQENTRGKIEPGSQISIEHEIGSEGGKLNISIKPPHNQEDHEPSRPTSTKAGEEVPGSVAKAAEVTTTLR